MTIHQISVVAGFAGLSGCAPYQLAPVESVLDDTPVVPPQLPYVFVAVPLLATPSADERTL